MLGVDVGLRRELFASRPNQGDANGWLGATAHLDESRDPGAKRARLRQRDPAHAAHCGALACRLRANRDELWQRCEQLFIKGPLAPLQATPQAGADIVDDVENVLCRYGVLHHRRASCRGSLPVWE